MAPGILFMYIDQSTISIKQLKGEVKITDFIQTNGTCPWLKYIKQELNSQFTTTAENAHNGHMRII